MRHVNTYEWGEIEADDIDPNAGGASHNYAVTDTRTGEVVVNVQFQHGPRLTEDAIPGALDDHLLGIEIDRMEGFQAGPFACEANARALEHLKGAQRCLRARAEERRKRGVLGKNEA